MGVRNFNAFSKDVRDFMPKTAAAAERFTRAVALQLLVRCVTRTPTDTGRARGGWQVHLDGPRDDAVDRLDRDGAATIEAGAAEVARLTYGQDVYIVNNVHYIVYLEDGTPKMRGVHMAARAVREVGAQFARVEQPR